MSVMPTHSLEIGKNFAPFAEKSRNTRACPGNWFLGGLRRCITGAPPAFLENQ